MAMLTTSTLSRRWPTARRGRSSRPVGKPRVKKMPLRSELLSQSALLLAASMLLPVCSQAQLAPPDERGVTMGHWHSIVPDVEASKKFWMLFAAKPITIDGTAVMKLPGILIFLTPGTPAGSTMGTSLNHVGLRVSNGKELKDRLKAAGVSEDPTDPVTG